LVLKLCLAQERFFDVENLIINMMLGDALVCGIVGYLVAIPRRAGRLGWMLGWLFGPLGVVAAFAFDNRPRCPQCSTSIQSLGKDKYGVVQWPKICPNCHAEIECRDNP
jgi:hypothetical protein